MNAANPTDKSSHYPSNEDENAEAKLEHSNPLSAISSLKLDLKASEMDNDSGSVGERINSSDEADKGVKKEDVSKPLLDEDDSDNDDDDEASYSNRGANSDQASRLKRRRRGAEEEVPMTFPQRLMEILSSDEHGDIISWLPHGRGFIIYQKKRFAAEIMPRYFKQSKFTSFTRKLNRWNFTRVTRGPETGAYYHEFFQRGNIRLCMQMCCQNAKGGLSSTLKQAQDILSPGLMEARAVGDAISRLRLGSVDLGGVVPGGNDFSILQNFPFGGQGGAQPPQGSGFAVTREEQLLQLRQLEQQREMLLQQQQQYQQQQQLQHHQQQLAALLAGSSSSQGGGNSASSQVAALLAGGSVSQGGVGSQGTPDMSLGALQRSNANAYLAMLMAQEKVQAQMSAFGGSGQSSSQQASNQFSPLEFQRQQANYLQSQQQQLELFNQQRMQQAQLQQQQQELPDLGLQQASDPSCNDLLQQQLLFNVLLQQQGVNIPGQDTSGGSEGNGGKISKRGASAA